MKGAGHETCIFYGHYFIQMVMLRGKCKLITHKHQSSHEALPFLLYQISVTIEAQNKYTKVKMLQTIY